jgi:ankyrin repeat protein
MRRSFAGDWTLAGLLAGLAALTTTSLWAGEIHDAAAAGDLNKVRAIVEADPGSVKSKDDKGCTPLTRACSRNRPAVANFLIDKGADVNAQGTRGESALDGAVARGDV